MTNIIDALEFCLHETENGVDVEAALTRFPEFKDELRPILETAVKARAMAVSEPNPEVVRRSRARVMQHAAAIRESRNPKRRIFPTLQRLGLSFALATVFLLSGGGIVNASASSLPGESLYPVKRGWESLRLFFVFDVAVREFMQNEFESERLHEANELLVEGRNEIIRIAGVFMQVNGLSYVSGLQVIPPVGMPIPADGDAVIVTGHTNAQGYIEVYSFEILPTGSIVPAGIPIQMEIESENGSTSGTKTVSEFEVKGTLDDFTSTSLVINGMTVYMENSKVEGKLCIGIIVEVKGYYARDGRFIASEVEGHSRCPAVTPSGSILNNGTNIQTPATETSSATESSSGDEHSKDDSEHESDDDDD